MSSTVDNRVVSMQFDNKQFESGAKTTMSTLEKLKDSLKFSDSAKGFDNVTKAANKVDFSGMGSAIESVRVKFSMMQMFALNAMHQITSSVINTGKRIANAFTFEPIMAGFKEYETQINSVQTILANTSKDGTTLRQVNAALDELNLYADKTIYNFTEMTRNIGTFTAAGLKLDVATKSIQGIANLAAVSGSTSQQASNAMYQLSQALSSGRVQLMDWNSVVNAGMGGKVFQDAIMETAKSMGAVSKEMQNAYENGASFRALLDGSGEFSGDKGWFTSEILAETLQKFTKTGAVEYLAKYTEVSGDAIQKLQDLGEESGYNTEAFKEMALSIAAGNETTAKIISDTLKMANTSEDAATKVKTLTQLVDTLKEAAQSGWTETWEIIIGDFGEAKELYTEISNTLGGFISESAKARNAFFSEGLKTGWKQFLDQGIMDEDAYTESIIKVAKTHNIAIDDMILEEGEFSKTLKRGWMTTEIATEALEDMCASVSGLSAEELKNKGYTQEQIDKLNELNKSIKNGASIREKFMNGEISSMSELGDVTNDTYFDMEHFIDLMQRPSGRENLIDSLRNSFKAVVNVVSVVKEAFSEIFPPKTGEDLYKLTVKIKEFTEKLVFTKEELEPFKRTIKGVFALLHIGVTIISRILSGIGSLIPVFSGAGGSVLGFTARVGDSLVALDKFISAGHGIQDVFQNIRDALINARDRLIQFKNDVMQDMELPGLEKVSKFIESIKNKFAELTGSTQKTSSTFSRIFSGLYKVVVFFAKGVIATIDRMLSIFGTNSDSLLNFVTAISATGILVLLKKLTKGFDGLGGSAKGIFGAITGLFNSLGGTFAGISGVLNELKGCLVAYQEELKSKALKNIAIAIAILVGSLWVLSSLDSEALQNGISGLTIIFIELMAAMTYYSKLGKLQTKGLAAMISIAIAVGILAGAMKKLSSLNADEIEQGLIAVGVLLAELGVMFKVLSSKERTYMKGAKSMISVAIAVYILTASVKKLGGMDLDEVKQGIIALGAVMAELSLFMNFTDFKKKAMSNAIGMILIAAALRVMATACKAFGEMDRGELVQGLLAIGAALTELSLFLNFTDKKKMFSTGVGLVLIAASMKILASALNDIAAIPGLQKALIGMGVGLAEISIAVNCLPKGMIGKAVGLVIVGAALKILASALSDIADVGDMKKALIGLGVGLLELVIALNLLKGTGGAAGALLVASVALSIFAGVITTLAKLSIKQIVIALGALAASLAIFGVAAMLLTPVIPSMLALAGAFALLGAACVLVGAGLALAGIGLGLLAGALAGGTVAIVAGLKSIAECIPDIVKYVGLAIIALCKVLIDGAPIIAEAAIVVIGEILKAAIVLIPQLVQGILDIILQVLDALIIAVPQLVTKILQLLIGIIDAVAENIGDVIQSGVNLIIAIFKGIVDAIKSLGGIGTEQLVEAIVCAGLMAGLIAAMAAIAGLVPAAMIGVLGMGAVVAELALVLAAIGGLAQIPGLKWLIDEGGDLLQGIGTAIGKFVGGIIGGIAEGATASLPVVGTNLSSFMTNLEPFLTGAEKIKPEMMDGVKSLIGVILGLTAANILDGLTSWFTGGTSFVKFGEELAAFGPYFMEYYNAISGMNPDVVVASANAAKALSEMCDNLPEEGGVVGWFTGESSLSKWASELKEFGPILMEYAESVRGLDSGVVVNSANAAKALAEMNDVLPEQGGVVGWFSGENSLSAWAKELVVFGPYLKDYADSVSGLDGNVIENSANAATALAKLNDTLPEQGGVVSWFTGDNTLSKFGEELSKFGPYLKEYADSVSGLDSSVITASVDAAKILVSLSNGLENSGGVVSWFTGDNDLETFGKQLKSFGGAMSGYGESVSTVNPETLSSTTAEFSKIIDLAKGLSGVDLTSFSGFGDAIQSVADAGIEKFTTAFDDSEAKVKLSILNFATYAVNAISSHKNRMDIAINDFVSFIATCIMSKAVRINTTIQTVTTNAVNFIRLQQSNFYDAGAYLVEGMAKGISDNKFKVEAKSRAMAQSALEAARKALDEHSPSKKGEEIGAYFPMGVAKGIAKMSSLVSKEAFDMGENASNSLTKSLNNLSVIISDGIDVEPTIKPILDLSNVEKGASRINTIFNRNQTMKINGSFANDGQINQNGNSGSNQVNYTFTQNNYSPKALSRVDIYRQTKNQLSSIERLAKA